MTPTTIPYPQFLVMMKESFRGPTILFYLASDANKNKREDDLNRSLELSLLSYVEMYCSSTYFFVRRNSRL